MKKLFSMILAGALMVGLLAGCGSTPAASTSGSNTETTAAF